MKKIININVCDIRGARKRQVIGTHRNKIVCNFCADTDDNLLNQCKDFAVTQGFTHYKGVLERNGEQFKFQGSFFLRTNDSHGAVTLLGNIRTTGTEADCLAFILENRKKDALNGKVSDRLFVQRNYPCREF